MLLFYLYLSFSVRYQNLKHIFRACKSGISVDICIHGCECGCIVYHLYRSDAAPTFCVHAGLSQCDIVWVWVWMWIHIKSGVRIESWIQVYHGCGSKFLYPHRAQHMLLSRCSGKSPFVLVLMVKIGSFIRIVR